MKIIATAATVPSHIVTNDDLAAQMSTSDDWIQSRTGIRQRHVVTTETNALLATAVARQLLHNADVRPAQLAFVIVATMSPDAMTPGVANQVQGALGAAQAMAFDVNAACAGFVYALNTAAGLLHSGLASLSAAGSGAADQPSYGIVIGSEVLSRLIDWHDRRTAVLFGDGAAGVLVSSEGALPQVRLRSFGQEAAKLTAGGQVSTSPWATVPAVPPTFLMDGRAVYHFATTTVATEIQATLATAGREPASVPHYLVHQANARLLSSLGKHLRLTADQLPTNIADYGNTSAASVPLLLHECVEQNTIRRGEDVLLCGFGGGLNVGTMLLTY